MKLVRLLLFPFSFLYGMALFFRNVLYNSGIFKEHSFDVPVIAVGNISTGGTGKSPHIEYLVKLLKKEKRVATLSRGYGRMSSGYVLAKPETPVYEIGDEPMQFKSKFPDLQVAVDTNRVNGIKTLLQESVSPQVVLLDDAFQHRAVKPGINILLTEYSHLYINDSMLPTGNLREWKSGAKRADIIVVTKTPAVFSPIERRLISEDLKPLPNQKVLFSYLRYGNFVPLKGGEQTHIPKEFYYDRGYSILLVTGIASPNTLLYYVKKGARNVKHLKFADHHRFSLNDIQKIRSEFDTFVGEKKIVLTTEKDAQRFLIEGLQDQIDDLPFFYIPIEVEFHDKDKEVFDQAILTYAGAAKTNS